MENNEIRPLMVYDPDCQLEAKRKDLEIHRESLGEDLKIFQPDETKTEDLEAVRNQIQEIDYHLWKLISGGLNLN